MPSKYRLRFIFKPLIQILAKGLIKIRITPNLTTIFMLCFAILSFIWISLFQNLLIFSILVFITGIMDGCDGTIARLTQKSTKFGAFFDSVMDRISEFFIFFGLIIFNWKNYLWDYIDMKLILFIAYLISFMISYCRARAEVFFKGDFDIGLMARSERLFYIFITMLFAFFFGFVAEFLFIYMWLVLGTYIYRSIKISTQIKKAEK
ncbi:MAG: CDP-alcohol phosphatidyltransferase family protein [Candidatus Lokiarchaeota archaeon]|nr:CDP-alcohol phosphatidyltransferase family protein [Candidatus Lokiarchaeota archaeon]